MVIRSSVVFAAVVGLVLIGTPAAFARKFPDKAAQSPLIGDYLLFGWNAGEDPIEDSPAYIGNVSITAEGQILKWSQEMGQKSAGRAKETSLGMGVAREAAISFVWVSNPSSEESYGSAVYSAIDENTMVGVWTEFGVLAPAFEQLVRFDASRGYRYDLFSETEKSMRRKVLQSYATSVDLSGAWKVAAWEGGRPNSLPTHEAVAFAKSRGPIVEINVGMGGRMGTGIFWGNEFLDIAWRSDVGQWGLGQYRWNGESFLGPLVVHGHEKERPFESLFPVDFTDGSEPQAAVEEKEPISVAAFG